ncbi:MAG: hypothetical protein M3179_02325 [Actinomycetota bacterium]|nr:hypothetical protein [Actinomycetota bacterium]
MAGGEGTDLHEVQAAGARVVERLAGGGIGGGGAQRRLHDLDAFGDRGGRLASGKRRVLLGGPAGVVVGLVTHEDAAGDSGDDEEGY